MDTKLLEIGHRLCTQRKKKGLTQDALAEKANVSAQTISHAELGKKAMQADTIIGVCGVLEISADYLLFGNTPPALISPKKARGHPTMSSEKGRMFRTCNGKTVLELKKC